MFNNMKTLKFAQSTHQTNTKLHTNQAMINKAASNNNSNIHFKQQQQQFFFAKKKKKTNNNNNNKNISPMILLTKQNKKHDINTRSRKSSISQYLPNYINPLNNCSKKIINQSNLNYYYYYYYYYSTKQRMPNTLTKLVSNKYTTNTNTCSIFVLISVLLITFILTINSNNTKLFEVKASEHYVKSPLERSYFARLFKLIKPDFGNQSSQFLTYNKLIKDNINDNTYMNIVDEDTNNNNNNVDVKDSKRQLTQRPLFKADKPQRGNNKRFNATKPSLAAINSNNSSISSNNKTILADKPTFKKRTNILRDVSMDNNRNDDDDGALLPSSRESTSHLTFLDRRYADQVITNLKPSSKLMLSDSKRKLAESVKNRETDHRVKPSLGSSLSSSSSSFPSRFAQLSANLRPSHLTLASISQPTQSATTTTTNQINSSTSVNKFSDDANINSVQEDTQFANSNSKADDIATKLYKHFESFTRNNEKLNNEDGDDDSLMSSASSSSYPSTESKLKVSTASYDEGLFEKQQSPQFEYHHYDDGLKTAQYITTNDSLPLQLASNANNAYKTIVQPTRAQLNQNAHQVPNAIEVQSNLVVVSQNNAPLRKPSTVLITSNNNNNTTNNSYINSRPQQQVNDAAMLGHSSSLPPSFTSKLITKSSTGNLLQSSSVSFSAPSIVVRHQSDWSADNNRNNNNNLTNQKLDFSPTSSLSNKPPVKRRNGIHATQLNLETQNHAFEKVSQANNNSSKQQLQRRQQTNLTKNKNKQQNINDHLMHYDSSAFESSNVFDSASNVAEGGGTRSKPSHANNLFADTLLSQKQQQQHNRPLKSKPENISVTDFLTLFPTEQPSGVVLAQRQQQAPLSSSSESQWWLVDNSSNQSGKVENKHSNVSSSSAYDDDNEDSSTSSSSLLASDVNHFSGSSSASQTQHQILTSQNNNNNNNSIITFSISKPGGYSSESTGNLISDNQDNNSVNNDNDDDSSSSSSSDENNNNNNSANSNLVPTSFKHNPPYKQRPGNGALNSQANIIQSSDEFGSSQPTIKHQLFNSINTTTHATKPYKVSSATSLSHRKQQAQFDRPLEMQFHFRPPHEQSNQQQPFATNQTDGNNTNSTQTTDYTSSPSSSINVDEQHKQQVLHSNVESPLNVHTTSEQILAQSANLPQQQLNSNVGLRNKLRKYLLLKMKGQSAHTTQANNSTSAATTSTTQQLQPVTPAPILSAAVANNIASLLVSKLSTLLPSRSSQSVQQQQVGHVTVSSPSKFSGFLNSRAGSSFASPVSHASHEPMLVTQHLGIAPLLFSGLVYGLSILPALMAITGINPLASDNQSSLLSKVNVASRLGGEQNKKSKQKTGNNKKSNSNNSKTTTKKHSTKHQTNSSTTPLHTNLNAFDSNSNLPLGLLIPVKKPLTSASLFNDINNNNNDDDDDHSYSSSNHHDDDGGDRSLSSSIDSSDEQAANMLFEKPSAELLSLYSPPPTIIEAPSSSSSSSTSLSSMSASDTYMKPMIDFLQSSGSLIDPSLLPSAHLNSNEDLSSIDANEKRRQRVKKLAELYARKLALQANLNYDQSKLYNHHITSNKNGLASDDTISSYAFAHPLNNSNNNNKQLVGNNINASKALHLLTQLKLNGNTDLNSFGKPMAKVGNSYSSSFALKPSLSSANQFQLPSESLKLLDDINNTQFDIETKANKLLNNESMSLSQKNSALLERNKRTSNQQQQQTQNEVSSNSELKAPVNEPANYRKLLQASTIVPQPTQSLEQIKRPSVQIDKQASLAMLLAAIASGSNDLASKSTATTASPTTANTDTYASTFNNNGNNEQQRYSTPVGENWKVPLSQFSSDENKYNESEKKLQAYKKLLDAEIQRQATNQQKQLQANNSTFAASTNTANFINKYPLLDSRHSSISINNSNLNVKTKPNKVAKPSVKAANSYSIASFVANKSKRNKQQQNKRKYLPQPINYLAAYEQEKKALKKRKSLQIATTIVDRNEATKQQSKDNIVGSESQIQIAHQIAAGAQVVNERLPLSALTTRVLPSIKRFSFY